MKSFRLYLREPITHPPRLAAEIPPEERKQLRDSFKPEARSHRRRGQLAVILFVTMFGCVLLALVGPKGLIPWCIGGFFVCWIAFAGMACLVPPLRCPACRNNVVCAVGPFCPECGARALQPGTFFRPPHCSGCGRVMNGGKTRHFRVRACTHCGLELDDVGL